MLGIFESYGVRFRYPMDWTVDVSEDGSRATIELLSLGPAFAIISVDEASPSPSEMADEALEAMRDEYPSLEAEPATQTIDGCEAIGYDASFFSLDLVIHCAIRCFQTPSRTIMVFGQWPEDDEEDASAFQGLVRSLEEE